MPPAADAPRALITHVRAHLATTGIAASEQRPQGTIDVDSVLDGAIQRFANA